MKYVATFFVVGSGSFGSAGLAQETPSGDVYQATIASDGVQHVSNLGGIYFFRPQRILVKVNVPVELEVAL